MNGILDLEGNIHACEPFEHMDLAYEIVDDMGVSVRNRLEAEEYLQKLGWIVIRTRDVYGLIGNFKDFESGSEERYHLTEAQKKWLNDHYEEMTTACRESVDKMLEWDK